MFFLTLALWAASFALSAILRPDPKNEEARLQGLGDFSLPTATQGRCIPLVWGTVKLSGPNIVWMGSLSAEEVDQHSGLFGTTRVIVAWQYFMSVQMALCLGPIDAFLSIWSGDQLIWEGPSGAGTANVDAPWMYGGPMPPNQGGLAGNISLYTGSLTQTASPVIGAEPPAYIWFDDYQQGLPQAPLNTFQGSDPNSYYYVSVNTSGSELPVPTATLDTASIMVTADNYGSVDANSRVIHVRSSIPSDTTPSPIPGGMYTAVLVHPEAPTNLWDNFSVTASIWGKPGAYSTAYDNGERRLAIGGMIYNVPGAWAAANAYGVFTIYDGVTLTLYVNTPSSGGAQLLGAVAVTLDTEEHDLTLAVSGTHAFALVDGGVSGIAISANFWDIPNIPSSTNFGFSIGIDSMLNDFSAVGMDLSACGIYSLGINTYAGPGAAIIPAYRGVAYAVAEQFYWGTQTQIAPWSFEVQRCPNNLGVSSTAHVNIYDANPMEVVYEILTNTVWGLSQSPTAINLASFQAAAQTLYNEGNGYSGVVDSTKQCAELLEEVERQIDGFIFVDRETGQWTVTLARGGYTAGSLSVIDETNTIRVKSFTQGAWEDTTNQVNVKFVARDNNYQEAYALAQDTANVYVQQGTVISVEERYAGVKNQTLANQIAWRDLRALSQPMSKASVQVDRRFYSVNPGDVLAFTYSALNISQRPMRVTRVDLGTSVDQMITLDLVQDVFGYALPSYADPSSTLHPTPPPVPRPAPLGGMVSFEAPYKLDLFSAVNPSTFNRVYVGADYSLYGSTAYGVYGGYVGQPFQQVGTVYGTLIHGTSSTSTGMPSTQGADTLVCTPPFGVWANVASTLVSTTAAVAGTSLGNLALIDNEFITYTGLTSTSTHLTLTGVYRGLLDTAPSTHAAGASVWFLDTGSTWQGTLGNVPYANGSTVAVSVSPTAGGVVGAANQQVVLGNRAYRPYPPSMLSVAGAVYPSTTLNLDAAASTGSGYGISFSYVRRDFRCANEISSMLSEASLPGDFPGANSTRYYLVVCSGGQQLFDSYVTSTSTLVLDRTTLLRYLPTLTIPSTLQVGVRVTHIWNSSTITSTFSSTGSSSTVTVTPISTTSLYPLSATVLVSTALSAEQNLGVCVNAPSTYVASGSYTAAHTGTYRVTTIGNVPSTLQYNANAAGWSTAISGGSSTGTFTTTSGYGVQLRVAGYAGGSTNLLAQLYDGTSSTNVAFGVFVV